jgi:hypothetical protein
MSLENQTTNQDYCKLRKALRVYADSDNWLPAGIDRETGEVVYGLFYFNGSFEGWRRAESALASLPASTSPARGQLLWEIATLAHILTSDGIDNVDKEKLLHLKDLADALIADVRLECQQQGTI